MSETLEARRPTIRHIPQGARALCGKRFGAVLRLLAPEQSWDALQRVSIFAKFVLQAPPSIWKEAPDHEPAQIDGKVQDNSGAARPRTVHIVGLGSP
jgi:hypothetical protein